MIQKCTERHWKDISSRIIHAITPKLKYINFFIDILQKALLYP